MEPYVRRTKERKDHLACVLSFDKFFVTDERVSRHRLQLYAYLSFHFFDPDKYFEPFRTLYIRSLIDIEIFAFARMQINTYVSSRLMSYRPRGGSAYVNNVSCDLYNPCTILW